MLQNNIFIFIPTTFYFFNLDKSINPHSLPPVSLDKILVASDDCCVGFDALFSWSEFCPSDFPPYCNVVWTEGLDTLFDDKASCVALIVAVSEGSDDSDDSGGELDSSSPSVILNTITLDIDLAELQDL